MTTVGCAIIGLFCDTRPDLGVYRSQRAPGAEHSLRETSPSSEIAIFDSISGTYGLKMLSKTHAFDDELQREQGNTGVLGQRVQEDKPDGQLHPSMRRRQTAIKVRLTFQALSVSLNKEQVWTGPPSQRGAHRQHGQRRPLALGSTIQMMA